MLNSIGSFVSLFPRAFNLLSFRPPKFAGSDVKAFNDTSNISSRHSFVARRQFLEHVECKSRILRLANL